MDTTTTLTVTLADSANEVLNGTNVNLTADVTNTGAFAAANVVLTITLDSRLTYSSGSGTGWAVSHSAGVVTCTRATLAVGAAPQVTVTVTAAHTSTVTATTTASVDADNVGPAGTDSENTTLTFVTKDATSGIRVPANQAEWDAFIAFSGLTNRGFSLTYNCQEASGDLAEADGGTGMTGSGTVSYQNSVSGWTRKGLGTTDGGQGGWQMASASGPQAGSQSVAMIAFIQINNATAERGQLILLSDAAGHAFYISITAAGLPKLYTNAGSGTGVVNHEANGVHCILIVLDRTNSTACAYTELEKRTGTYNAAVASGKKSIADFGAAANADAYYLYAAMGAGTEAEWTSTSAKSLFQALGYSPSWS